MNTSEKQVQSYKKAEKSSKIAKGALIKHNKKAKKNSIWNTYNQK